MAATLLLAGTTAVAVAQTPEAPLEPIVADLRELPADKTAHSVHSVQLALARAGNRIISVGEQGIILLSDDEGVSWRQAENCPVSVALTDVAFVNAQTGWAVGHSGIVLKTADGGETWSIVMDGVGAADVMLASAQRALDDGIDGADRHLRSAQYLVQDGPDKPFLKVFFADENTGWLLGAYGLALKTADGGDTWSSAAFDIPNDFGAHLYDMSSVDGLVIIAGEQAALFASTDGGGQFSALETPYEGTYFGGLSLSRKDLLVYGLRGNVWTISGSGDEQGLDVSLDDDAGASAMGAVDDELPEYDDWRQIDTLQPVTIPAAIALPDGRVLLADQSGRLMLASLLEESVDVLTAGAGGGVTDIILTQGGALVASGPRGVRRLELAELASELN